MIVVKILVFILWIFFIFLQIKTAYFIQEVESQGSDYCDVEEIISEYDEDEIEDEDSNGEQGDDIYYREQEDRMNQNSHRETRKEYFESSIPVDDPPSYPVDTSNSGEDFFGEEQFDDSGNGIIWIREAIIW